MKVRRRQGRKKVAEKFMPDFFIDRKILAVLTNYRNSTRRKNLSEKGDRSLDRVFPLWQVVHSWLWNELESLEKRPSLELTARS